MVGPELSRRIPYYERLRLSACHYFGTGIFLTASLLHNYGSKRPFSASLLKHAAFVVGGFIAGDQAAKYLEYRRSQQVSVIEDYICKHPEDFPRVQPKKYKDILLPWAPIR